MNKQAYIVINDGSAFEGKLSIENDCAKILYSTEDGTFAITASLNEMKVRFVSKSVSYTLLLSKIEQSTLSLQANAVSLAPAPLDLDLYEFRKDENSVFMTAQYCVEKNPQTLTLSATLID